jgi:predicted GNAT family acetyltransferase
MGPVETTVTDNPGAHRFEITVDGKVAGFAAYQRDGSTVSFTHTEIEPAFEGKGLGSALARGALDATRAEGRSVLPFCPFIRGYLARHADYADLVPADQRSKFGLDPGA